MKKAQGFVSSVESFERSQLHPLTQMPRALKSISTIRKSLSGRAIIDTSLTAKGRSPNTCFITTTEQIPTVRMSPIDSSACEPPRDRWKLSIQSGAAHSVLMSFDEPMAPSVRPYGAIRSGVRLDAVLGQVRENGLIGLPAVGELDWDVQLDATG